MGIRKIVVAYDGSVGSEKALQWALTLANAIHSQLVIATVVRPPEFSASIDEVDAVYEEGEKYAQPLLAKAVAQAENLGLEADTVILKGHPAESLVRYAANRQVDLIVLGTRGLGGFKSLIIGSVAQKVVTYSTVPVTVIK